MRVSSLFSLIIVQLLFCSVALASKSPNHKFAERKSAFVEFEWEDAQTTAIREGKMIVVDLSAKWCLPCKWMEEKTFTDDDLINVMSSKFISLNYDIESFDGVYLKHHYAVRRLPTILILNPEGEEIKRFTESMSAHALRYELNALTEKYQFEKNPHYKLKREGLSRTVKSSENTSQALEPKAEIQGDYRLQFGVFSSKTSAENLKSSIRLELQLEERNANGKTLYAVVSRDLFEKEQANSLSEEMMERDHLESLVKKVK